MTINKPTLIIMLFPFILSGCFTNMLSKKIKNNYPPKKEFAGPLGIENENLIAKEHYKNIFKGKYLGEELKNAKTYGHLQFEGMLKGDNRVLDIYFDLDTNSFPEFHEVKNMEQGLDAYLFLTEEGFSGAMTRQYFDQAPEKIANPELFYDYANLDKTQIPDTCVIMGLYYYYNPVNSIKSEAITNIYTKTKDNSYSVKQIRSECSKDKAGNHFHFKYIERSKTKKVLNKMMYALTVPVDIITSPFQLLGYFITTRSFNKGPW